MRNDDLKRVNEALNVLGEHFDSVHVFATRHESGELNGTIRISRGTGNYFARYGQIKSWVSVEEAIECHRATKESNV
jgi:hypothetical protein